MYILYYKDDLANDYHELPFTIIGADSALMHEPIHTEKTFNLAPAERVDILIRFGEELPESATVVYMICDDFNDGNIHIKMKLDVTNGNEG